MALGMIEVYGFTTSIVVADKVAKAADVEIVAIDKNKPANAETLKVPLLVTIKFRGSVEDVTAAVEAGIEMAKKTTGVVQSHIIPRPTQDTIKMLNICGFDTN